jgi:hypothetical protein
MKLKLMVQTQLTEDWPASDRGPAQHLQILNCIDMSQPADCRMTENITYKLKPSEIERHWNHSLDKLIEVVCRRIAHSKAGKAMLIGEIVEPAVSEPRK